MSENFTYDATFSNNILVVGQMGCGESSFVQSLGKNKMLDNGLLSVNWVSKINLKKAGEDEIKKCFEYTKVRFHYPNDTNELDLIIETFKKESFEQINEETNSNFECSIFRENKKFVRLIYCYGRRLRSSRQVKWF